MNRTDTLPYKICLAAMGLFKTLSNTWYSMANNKREQIPTSITITCKRGANKINDR